MKLYDTLSQKKKTLRPKSGNTLNVFVCGPTVYDYSHIGHARTYIDFDMAVKYLRNSGYDVFYLQNVTDVDDKIIKRAKEKKETAKVLAKRFEKEYYRDMKQLGVNAVTSYRRATDHIAEIIAQVEGLLKKGYAYTIEGDGVYYDVSKFKDYGKLAHRTTEQAEDGVSRIDESVKKRNKADFALWKFSNPPAGGGEPKWKSPWGMGRPGWHIEDTAITEKYFGPQYDIHGGARDLVFPHHEAEVSQMEALSGKKPFVAYWLHTGFLTVKGDKMSKSLGNFITIRDFLDDHAPRLLRFFILKSHYRSPIDFTEDNVLQADRELQRIDEFVARLRAEKPELQFTSYGVKPLKNAQKAFKNAMDDDLNTPLAFSILFEFMKEINTLLDQRQLSKSEIKDILQWLKDIDRFLEFIFWGAPKKGQIPSHIQKLVDDREKYRKTKNWKKADQVRNQLFEEGWEVKDTSSGPVALRVRS